MGRIIEISLLACILLAGASRIKKDLTRHTLTASEGSDEGHFTCDKLTAGCKPACTNIENQCEQETNFCSASKTCKPILSCLLRCISAADDTCWRPFFYKESCLKTCQQENEASWKLAASEAFVTCFDREIKLQGPFKKKPKLPTPVTAKQRMSNRASLGFVKGMLGMKGNNNYDVFCSRSKDKVDGYCATVDGFPGPNSHTELRFKEVVDGMMSTPAREINGTIRKMGDLGYFIFNGLLWANDWKTFPIGADLEDHRKHRTTIDMLTGTNSKAWSRAMLRKMVTDFFKKRRSFTNNDLSLMINKYFHKQVFDIDLSDVEAQDFEDYKKLQMKVSILPRWLTKAVGGVMGLKDAQKRRELWLARYDKAIDDDKRDLEVVNVMKSLTGRDKRFFCDMGLTAMTSAGGLSLPTALGLVVTILYGGDKSPLQPAAERVLTESKIKPLIYETVRRFPVVVGFPSWSMDLKQRSVLNIPAAMNDPRVWERPKDFFLKPVSEYHSKVGSSDKAGVSWAEQAKGPVGLTADSRGCPARQMSVVLMEEFLRVLMPMQDDWKVTNKLPESGLVPSEGPSSGGDFTLTFTGDESTSAHFNSGDKPETPKFECPSMCKSCCVTYKGWDWMGRKDKTKFKCVFDVAENPIESIKSPALPGRECEPAKVRNSNKAQGKVVCEFTDNEVAAKYFDTVEANCPTEAPSLLEDDEVENEEEDDKEDEDENDEEDDEEDKEEWDADNLLEELSGAPF